MTTTTIFLIVKGYRSLENLRISKTNREETSRVLMTCFDLKHGTGFSLVDNYFHVLTSESASTSTAGGKWRL